jgi:uncharacterized sulfatase
MGHDPKKYPVERILAAADVASSMRPGATKQLEKFMADPDSAVRYWGATGALIRGAEEVKSCHAALTRALMDESPYVRIPAAEALAKFGPEMDASAALSVLIGMADCRKTNLDVALTALNAIDALGRKAAPFKDKIAALPDSNPEIPARENYIPRLRDWITKKLAS